MSPRRTRFTPVLVATTVLAAGAAITVSLLVPGSTIPVGPAAEPGQANGSQMQGPAIRKVLLSATDDGALSRPGGPQRAFLARGRMPAATTQAIVLTDENCAPDRQGVSHCTNRLRLGSGAILHVIHNHRMGEVPCLSPGERVLVEPAA